MTPAQQAKILTLASQLLGRHIGYISQAYDVLPFSKSAISRGLTKGDASQAIDELQRKIAAKEERDARAANTPIATGTLTAEQVLAMLGRTVELHWTRQGQPETATGVVEAIVPSDVDGTPAVNMPAAGKLVRVSVVTAWRTL
jgi:hypothetical protein